MCALLFAKILLRLFMAFIWVKWVEVALLTFKVADTCSSCFGFYQKGLKVHGVTF